MVDRVLSRPLFRGRSGMEMEARDSRRIIPSPILGDTSATPRPGIESALMATDPYLLETFAPLPPSNRPRSARELAAEETGSTIRSGLGTLADRTAGTLSAVGSGLYGVSADMLSPAFATLGATTLAGQMERASDIAYNVARSNLANGLSATEGMSAADFDMEPAQFDFVIARAEADARRAEEVRSELPPPEGRSGMEMEARGRKPPSPLTPLVGARPEGPAAGMPAAPGATDQGPSPMEADARARAPVAAAAPLVTNPTEVAAALNAPDPAMRERTVEEYMREFTAAAPKYEGGDKRLMHAMIGFAIAAGESPNAMTNIAKGLQAGAEMFLKDKAAKDEFDRQIQLSAMQYGLGEVAKERALDRQFTNYVASTEVTYRGRKYGPNESVPVLHSDILNGRMPSGVITEGTSDALLATDAAVRKALIEAEKEKTLTPAAFNEAIKNLDDAASNYSSASNLMPLLEASLVRTAQGQVTGVQSALTTKLNQVMNAFDLKPPEEYESRDAYDSAMKQASVSLVQDLLGESGKTISDADRVLIDGLIGLYTSEYSKVTTDPDILIRKIQELMRTVEGKQRTALDTYNTYMSGYSGTYSPSGTPVMSYRAERVFSPEAMAAAPIEYVWDQATNRLVLKRDGGQ